MVRDNRIGLLKSIGKVIDADVVTYITGDRVPTPARIAQDAIRPMYGHLLELRKRRKRSRRGKRLGLIIYSRGGDVSVPWRIISMLRECYQEIYVLIPYKAYSAATMIALGADKIVMGKKAELGPIDPTLVRVAAGESTAPAQEISVEDVSSYISFMRERANINDQSALATVISQLAQDLKPLTLGRVNREHSHIRLVGKKLLSSHCEKMDEERMNLIIEALTEKMYSHGHAISRREAIELRLPIVEKVDDELENYLWALYEDYEEMLMLNEPIDFELTLSEENTDKKILENIAIACIESILRLDIFSHHIRIIRRRKIPPNPQININVNVGLPPGINVQQIPQQAQQILQQLIQQLMPNIQQQVQRELVRQSPAIGIETNIYGGRWRKVE